MKLLVSNRGRPALRAAFFLALAVFCAGLSMAQNQDLAALSRTVRQLMADGHFEEAIPICEQLVKAMPGNPGLVLNLGLAEEMAGHPGKAVPRFEEVLKVEPENTPALTSLATVQLQLNHPQLALPPLKKLLTLEPSNHKARGMLAGALMGVELFDEAAAQYRKLTAEDATDAKAWYGLGTAYESLAAHSFERISQHAPDSPYAAALIAYSRLDRQQYRSAFFFFRLAEEKLPKLRGLHAGLAKVYQETGHAEWAAIEEKEEESLPPPSCSAGPAECYFVQNRYLESAKAAAMDPTAPSLFWGAKAYHQLALEAFARLGGLPESVELHAVKAKILHGHNQDIEAANEWRAALRLAPGNRGLESELATSLFLAHDYKPAMALIEELLPRDASSPDLNFMMGESLLRTEQPDKAVSYLETALRADNKMMPAHASLGLALAKLDRGGDAIPHLEKALTLDDDGSLHYTLARAYQQAGNLQRSRELMEAYQRIQKQNREQKDELAKDTQIAAPAGN
jgi:tetratricopeptide (TPR) repeat protein